jgi:hypothetical protein
MRDFTVEETNLICAYGEKTLAELVRALEALASETDDADMRDIALSAKRKLTDISDEEFIDTKFYPA